MLETIISIIVLVAAASLVLFAGGIFLNKRMREDNTENEPEKKK